MHLHCVAARAREARAGDAACVLGAPVCLRVCAHVRGRAQCFSAHVQRALVSECANTSAFVRAAGCVVCAASARLLVWECVCLCDCGACVSVVAKGDSVCL